MKKYSRMVKETLKSAVSGLLCGIIVGFGVSKLRNAEKKDMENAFEKRHGITPGEKGTEKKA